MDWTKLALSLPSFIGIAMHVAEQFKSPGSDKQAAVIAAVKTGFGVAEVATGKDLVNDAALDELLKDYINARVALQNFVTKKAPTDVPEGVILPMPAVLPTIGSAVADSTGTP